MKTVTMRHPKLKDSERTVGAAAFERVWVNRGWELVEEGGKKKAAKKDTDTSTNASTDTTPDTPADS